MKKIKSLLFLTGVITAIMLVPVEASEIKVYLNGNKLEFDEPPVIRNDRVFVPMRGILEELGFQVDYEPTKKVITATKADNKILMQVGNPKANVRGKNIEMDEPAFVKGGRTLVPLRFIGESAGISVKWENGNVILGETYTNPVDIPEIKEEPVVPETKPEVKPSNSDVEINNNMAVEKEIEHVFYSTMDIFLLYWVCFEKFEEPDTAELAFKGINKIYTDIMRHETNIEDLKKLNDYLKAFSSDIVEYMDIIASCFDLGYHELYENGNYEELDQMYLMYIDKALTTYEKMDSNFAKLSEELERVIEKYNIDIDALSENYDPSSRLSEYIPDDYDWSGGLSITN